MWYHLFLILGILTVIAEFSMLYAWILAKIRYKKQKKPNYNPKTYIIIPCKGIEKNFEKNVKAIRNQNYQNFNLIFVTDSKEDPAYKTLKKLFDKDEKTSIVTSIFIKGCSGKISALINGLKYVKDAEVYVFADSDISPHNRWLSYLVSYLKNENIGVTTGYRWFFPTNLKSLFISCWNMANSLSLFYSSYNFAWGGSMAIKKSLFDKLQIEKEWKTGFSDDLILTKKIKSNGYEIKFLPQCMSESPVEGNIWSFIKWGTRQLTWIRWYFPSIWIISVIGALSLKIATITGFILLAAGYLIPGLLMISTILFEMITGGIAHSTIKNNMFYSKDRFGKSYSYAIIMPIVFFVIAFNNLSSIVKSEIRWAGRSYKKPK